jgi:hypothetical protein
MIMAGKARLSIVSIERRLHEQKVVAVDDDQNTRRSTLRQSV